VSAAAAKARAGVCARQCTNGGRYCAPNWPVPSSFVVEENLRQLCVFQVRVQYIRTGSEAAVEMTLVLVRK
jgi:hypothetical protein